MDPDFSQAHRRFIEDYERVLTDGYTTTEEHERGADWHWLCPPCVADFAEKFGLRVEGGPLAGGSSG
jgi:hypothetical protein